MNTKEVWKDVPNYEGYYQISDLGNVRSLDRFVNSFVDIKKTMKGQIIKHKVDKHGYCCINLNKLGIKTTYKIHKLVAIAFLNHTPCRFKIVVDHINNIKTDNRLENLQLTTNRHNSSKDRKGTSRYTGVSLQKSTGKWLSHIRIDSKKVYLGTFTNEQDASKAYQNELRTLK